MHRRAGTGQCDFSARSDYALVIKIMQTIECHHRDECTSPDPCSLRDTMLAVAALLQLEAIKIYGRNQPIQAEDGEAVRERFTGAASCQFDAVIEATALIRRDGSGEYQ
jgi:hypothetical protein